MWQNSTDGLLGPLMINSTPICFNASLLPEEVNFNESHQVPYSDINFKRQQSQLVVMQLLVNHTGALFSLVIFFEVFELFQKLGSNTPSLHVKF